MSKCTCNGCTHYAKAKIREEIEGFMANMNLDELKVLWYTASGLDNGRALYGSLNTSTDKRDMGHEAMQEIRDALVYVGTRLVQLEQ